jgi:hypothetical protein
MSLNSLKDLVIGLATPNYRRALKVHSACEFLSEQTEAVIRPPEYLP